MDLDNYNFSSIFVDPPRSGMDVHTTSITQRYDNIMYISCNPMTLKENIKTMITTHDITNVAVFDQFPGQNGKTRIVRFDSKTGEQIKK